jgi:hypothetical protein
MEREYAKVKWWAYSFFTACRFTKLAERRIQKWQKTIKKK